MSQSFWRLYFDGFSLTPKNLNLEGILELEFKVRNDYQKKHTVYFESDEFDLSLDELNKLNKFMLQIPKNDKIQIGITGHTDSDASLIYNLELSKSRVEEVSKKVLEMFSWKLIKLWKGEGSPLNNNINAIDKAQNRRVELSIIP